MKQEDIFKKLSELSDDALTDVLLSAQRNGDYPSFTECIIIPKQKTKLYRFEEAIVLKAPELSKITGGKADITLVKYSKSVGFGGRDIDGNMNKLSDYIIIRELNISQL